MSITKFAVGGVLAVGFGLALAAPANAQIIVAGPSTAYNTYTVPWYYGGGTVIQSAYSRPGYVAPAYYGNYGRPYYNSGYYNRPYFSGYYNSGYYNRGGYGRGYYGYGRRW